MRYSKLHITVNIILLGTVVFFSTGFTTIVKYCSMSQSSDCCCESDHSDKSATQANEPSVSAQNCITIKVIGGLNEIKAPVNPELSEKTLISDAVNIDSHVISLSTPTYSLSLAYPDDIAPPQGDIYIRIRSLLI